MTRVVVIGAGVGGLAAAAVLARAGVDVTVLEAQTYPGGCAGTFYHQGYRFDAGATLAAGFYPGGPMDLLAAAAGISDWRAHPADLAMRAHLPGGLQVELRGDESRWAARQAAFGRQAEPFFRWQESTADSLWDLALRLPAWPPQSPRQAGGLLQAGLSWLGQGWRSRLKPALLADAFRPVAAHLRDAPASLRLFVDAQLLISAQATGPSANALYGAAALDLPRRGVVHLEGGMGRITETLVQAIRRHGGRVLFRKEVTRVSFKGGDPVGEQRVPASISLSRSNAVPVQVKTRRGEIFLADAVIANLLPWDVARLLEEEQDVLAGRLTNKPLPADAWGAFIVYIGVNGQAVPQNFPLHHQVVLGRPLAEGNSVFLSLSPEWDASRAPAGRRAMTLSTHTDLASWWRLYEQDRPAYERRKAEYARRLLSAAETALPGLRQATELVLPGTPVTFQRFTGRSQGWVGGFPQTHLFRSRKPQLASRLWMVGDSIFPGQSTAAVALGGLRVAKEVLLAPGLDCRNEDLVQRPAVQIVKGE